MSKSVKLVGIGIVSVLLIGLVFPARIVAADSHWIQISVSDFNSDTMTNLEIHTPSPSSTQTAFVHLVDNASETHTSDYVMNSYWPIDTRVNHKIACAFHPTFNGMCDQVDFKIYVHGSPVDANGDPATLTIDLYTEASNGIHQPNNPNPIISHTYTCSSLPFTNGNWFPLYFTETDSLDNTVERYQNGGTNLYYSVKVSSNAVWASISDEFRWEYNSNSDSSEITTDQDIAGGIGWQIFGGNPNNPIDMNVKIHWHDFTHTGNLVSVVYNTGSPSTFTYFLASDRPPYPTYYVRTGNTNPPDGSWSNWVEQTNNASWNGENPNGQYVQFKFVLIATDDPLQYDAFTGAVQIVDIWYI